MSLVTTLPAPMTVLSPMVTPGTTITPAPSQQFLPMCIIHTGQPEVSINMITKMNMPSAPVCIKRRLDITAFSCFCEHFFDQLCSFFHLGWAGLIVVVHFFQAGHLETYKFFDVWIEKNTSL
jgi:hypothetical protein